MSELDLTGVDIVIAIAVCLSAMLGLVRGLVAELFSLVTWIAAVLLAIVFAPAVAEFLLPYLGSATVRSVVAYAGIFIATLMVGGIIRALTRSLIDTAGLSGLDRILGLVFGSLRGCLICIIALIMLRPLAGESDWWSASEFVPRLMAFEQDVLDLLGRTSEVADQVSEQVLGKPAGDAAKEAFDETLRESASEAAERAVEEAMKGVPAPP